MRFFASMVCKHLGSNDAESMARHHYTRSNQWIFTIPITDSNDVGMLDVVGRGGALVETMTFNRSVVGSTPALAVT